MCVLRASQIPIQFGVLSKVLDKLLLQFLMSQEVTAFPSTLTYATHLISAYCRLMSCIVAEIQPNCGLPPIGSRSSSAFKGLVHISVPVLALYSSAGHTVSPLDCTSGRWLLL